MTLLCIISDFGEAYSVSCQPFASDSPCEIKSFDWLSVFLAHYMPCAIKYS